MIKYQKVFGDTKTKLEMLVIPFDNFTSSTQETPTQTHLSDLLS